MLTDIEKEELRKAACEVRCNIVKMVHNSKSGHPGGSLSGADILTVLYKNVLIFHKTGITLRNLRIEIDLYSQKDTHLRFFIQYLQ